MAKSIFRTATITGLCSIVPEEERAISDELEYYGGSKKKADRITAIAGMDRRRVAPAGVTPADLCQQAAERLFDGMGVEAHSIDTLIFVSQGPDHVLPATACILQYKLGLPQTCATFDVNQGCAGYTYGLWLAYSLIESRASSKVLLLVGEGLTRLFDADNRIVAPVFGDCGTATLIEASPEESPAWFLLGTDGSGAEAIMVPAGRARLPLPLTPEEYTPYCERLFDSKNTPWRLTSTYMDGGAVFDFTLRVIPDHIRELLAYADTNQQDIDHLVLHQANKQIIQTIAEKSGFSKEQTPHGTFGKFGNQAGASIPCALCDTFSDQLAYTSLRLLLCGYGVGLSWASALFDVGPIWCGGVLSYVRPENHPTPMDVLTHWQKKIREA